MFLGNIFDVWIRLIIHIVIVTDNLLFCIPNDEKYSENDNIWSASLIQELILHSMHFQNDLRLAKSTNNGAYTKYRFYLQI